MTRNTRRYQAMHGQRSSLQARAALGLIRQLPEDFCNASWHRVLFIA